MSDLISELLFKTKAIKVAPESTPFWYTSGKLGPFYCNTHFLLKDEDSAVTMLKNIEEAISKSKVTAPKEIFDLMYGFYQTSESFKTVTDALVEKAKEFEFDFISGGERRDFFFSMVPAFLLGKPHLTIYKDLTSAYSNSDFTNTVLSSEADLKGKKALHIADLITVASSYERAWVPALKDLGADITDTIAVVDRHQGGEEVLKALGVSMYTLTGVDKDLFDLALKKDIINKAQYDLVIKFLDDPDEYMKSFLKNNPDFIASQIAMGGKAKERAELAISKGFV
ncbi:MAG: orotate phosphoribosyltransferase [Clostridiales bacterium]|nr:orotate phosphoribosyltransferase [Clostridiales bacterium]